MLDICRNLVSVHVYDYFLFTVQTIRIEGYATKKVLNFRLCDTVGFQEQFAFDSQEFAFILCGNLPDCYQVNYILEVIYYAMSPLIRDVFAQFVCRMVFCLL